MIMLNFIFTTWQGLAILWVEVGLILWLAVRNIPNPNHIKWQERSQLDRFQNVVECFLFPVLIAIRLISFLLEHSNKVLEFKLDFWRE